MKERPILFSTPMVQAIMRGEKTQTRRLVKLPENDYQWDIGGKIENDIALFYASTNDRSADIKCPYGKVGDVLWVRETYCSSWEGGSWKPIYRADGGYVFDENGPVKWRPSIYMPKKYARIKLEITNIKVERLNEISENDCMAEGITLPNYAEQAIKDVYYPAPSDIYQTLWESINGKGSFGNQFVWVIEFTRI